MRTRILIVAVLGVWLGGASLASDADARQHVVQNVAPDLPAGDPMPPAGSDPWVPDGGPNERIAAAPNVSPVVEDGAVAPESRLSIWVLRIIRLMQALPVGGPAR